MPMGKKNNQGAGKYGSQRRVFEKNRRVILMSQDVCAICGKPVDKSLKFPHPLSPAVDHIIPWEKGGDCSLDNLQLTHLCCNRQKADKIYEDRPVPRPTAVSNRNLPQTFDW